MAHPIIESFSEHSQKTMDYLVSEFSSLQIGRASPVLVENLLIKVYGGEQPIKALATITVDGPQSLMISPWDKSILSAIEKAIREESALGLSPVNDGAGIRLNIPNLTEERRRDLTKVVSKMAEESKIGIRKHRHDALEKIKKDESLSEDMQKSLEKELQKKVDEYNQSIEESEKRKSAEIMKI